jgi:hypothetical protein
MSVKRCQSIARDNNNFMFIKNIKLKDCIIYIINISTILISWIMNIFMRFISWIMKPQSTTQHSKDFALQKIEKTNDNKCNIINNYITNNYFDKLAESEPILSENDEKAIFIKKYTELLSSMYDESITNSLKDCKKNIQNLMENALDEYL